MDFHTLARKALQTLCKKNKIPANMTNVAMADALKSLEHVEGLDEVWSPSVSDTLQTPAKNVIGSSEIPHTSTQRKPIEGEPESSQPLTQTRGGTRRRVSKEADQENKDTNVPETRAMLSSRRRGQPADLGSQKMKIHFREVDGNEENSVQGKSDVPATPAVPSSRRRVPAASTYGKMETQKEESSVHRVYSTRRSVRLLEKNMAELSLKERERIEPIKIDELSIEVEEKKDTTGTDVQKISEVRSENTADSEILSDQKANGLPENKIGSQDVQLIIEGNDVELDDHEAKPEVDSGKPDNLGAIVVSDVNDGAYAEISDKARIRLGENLEKTVVTVDEKGLLVLLITEISPEIENPNGLLKSGNEKGLNALQDEKLEDFLSLEVSSDVSVEVMNQIVATRSLLLQDINNSASGEKSVKSNSLTLSASEEILVGKDSDWNVAKDDDHGNFVIDDTEVDQMDSDATVLEEQMVCSEQLESRKVLGIPGFSVDNEKSKEDSDKLVMESNATDAFPGDTDVDSGSENSFADQMEVQVAVNSAKQQSIVEGTTVKMEKYSTEALVDIQVVEATDCVMKNFKCHPLREKTPKYVKQMNSFSSSSCGSKVTDKILFSSKDIAPCHAEDSLSKMQDYSNSDTLVDVYVMPEVEFLPSLDNTPNSIQATSPYHPLASCCKVMGEIPFSPLGGDPLPGQFPHPQMTPRKSSSKKQTTNQKLTQVSDGNKENIDNTGSLLEHHKDKEKNKKIRDKDCKQLDDLSLRLLTKMYKEKLQIKNNIENERQSKQQVEKPRQALQTLPENCMAADEAGKEN